MSWLNALSKLMKVPLEHEDAPVLGKYSGRGVARACSRDSAKCASSKSGFRSSRASIGGWKGVMFNTLFVGTFNALPRSLVRRFGWHLLAFCRK